MLRIAVPSLLGLLLAACASFAPNDVRPGQSAAEVTQRLGTPTHRYALPEGASRLEYARGPYGLQTWMVDLDPSGQVRQIRQVLTENDFATVRPGDTREELLLKVGRPSEVGAAWRDRKLWYWRYENYICRWFAVTLTPDDRVQDAGLMPDPACDDDDNDAMHVR